MKVKLRVFAELLGREKPSLPLDSRGADINLELLATILLPQKGHDIEESRAERLVGDQIPMTIFKSLDPVMPDARSTLGFHSPFCTNLVELGFMSPMPQSIPTITS